MIYAYSFSLNSIGQSVILVNVKILANVTGYERANSVGAKAREGGERKRKRERNGENVSRETNYRRGKKRTAEHEGAYENMRCNGRVFRHMCFVSVELATRQTRELAVCQHRTQRAAQWFAAPVRCILKRKLVGKCPLLTRFTWISTPRKMYASRRLRVRKSLNDSCAFSDIIDTFQYIFFLLEEKIKKSYYKIYIMSSSNKISLQIFALIFFFLFLFWFSLGIFPRNDLR